MQLCTKMCAVPKLKYTQRFKPDEFQIENYALKNVHETRVSFLLHGSCCRCTFHAH